ncbi:unnamed protein product [Protopolystoma xenopodis]|uniref:Phospholipid/glycerol acyltransferase domain-containing protein n=1 Tax=Protopolystoma xenopodis TaxID=117903 RepID=A0A448WMU3_9PLAT|nr:unnamed protein product [Protopolystoma xenopodis]
MTYIGQRHIGFFGLIEHLIAFAVPTLWFDRDEVFDRMAVAKKLKQHVFSGLSPASSESSIVAEVNTAPPFDTDSSAPLASPSGEQDNYQASLKNEKIVQNEANHSTKSNMARTSQQGALPLLIFPEGTCINNTSVMKFKKRCFEIGAVIHPVAIKVWICFGNPIAL